MIPFVIVPPIKLGALTLQPFGLLVAIGVGLSWTLIARRGRTLGFVDDNVNAFLWWMIIAGFVISHLFEEILYHPQEVLDNPLTLLMIWKGISSFGGFGGATLGGIAWKYFKLQPLRAEGLLSNVSVPVRRDRPMPLLPYADLFLAAFPIGWAFGRTGCAISHDHPGALAPAHSWFSVAYGPGRIVDHGLYLVRYGSVPRYDLGFLELLFTLVIAIGFVFSWRRGGVKGYYVAAASLIYAPIRFVLDFLRATDAEGGDARYGQLTPAQWACLLLFAYGFWVLRYIRRAPVAQPPYKSLP